MDTVIRACFVYLLLLVIFRIAGKRSLAQITTFDLILTLIISEAIQQALIDTDNSLTNAAVVVVTLVGLDVLLAWAGRRFGWFGNLVGGTPLLVVQEGKLLTDHMRRERVEATDILHAAREHHGIERLDQIKYAIVERSGGITIVPKE